MLLDTIAFFCFIMIASIAIRKALYLINLGPFKWVLHVLDFIGVVVHEAGHAIACVLLRVPINEIHVGWRSDTSTSVSPHGHVVSSIKEWTFLKGATICLAPLIVSTWLLILSLDAAFNENLPDLVRVFCGLACVSLILGASPSSHDFSIAGAYFKKDIQYSFYQLVLLTFSIMSIALITSVLGIIFFLPVYLFLAGMGYTFYKYLFSGIGKLARNRHLRLETTFKKRAHVRKTHKPLRPVQLGFEEAHW